MLNTVCIFCNNKNNDEISLESIKSGFTLISCDKCKSIYLVDIIDKVDFQNGNMIFKECTNIEILTPVFIINELHEKYGKEGVIINKDDLTYKIKLDNDETIWVLYDWVMEEYINED
jgi:hypothetical protein